MKCLCLKFKNNYALRKCFKKGLKFNLLSFIFFSLINVLYCIFSYLFDEGIFNFIINFRV